MFRIAGEGRELVAAGEDARPHVIRELGRVVEADVGYLAVAALQPRVVPKIHEALSFGWRTKREEEKILAVYATSPPEIDPLLTLVLQTPGEVVTRKLADAPCEWIKHELHRPASVDSSIISLRRIGGGLSRLLIVKRAWGDRAFEDEDCETLDLFLSEHESLFAPPEAPTPHLSPRERETLDLLMMGLPEKLIAARMGVSRHTVHDYVKVVYRKHGVGSRPELMATVRRDLPRRKTG